MFVFVNSLPSHAPHLWPWVAVQAGTEDAGHESQPYWGILLPVGLREEAVEVDIQSFIIRVRYALGQSGTWRYTAFLYYLPISPARES